MAEIIALPLSPAERLRASLRGLDMALREQANALGAFRHELADLRQATEGLGHSLGTYRQELDGCAGAAAGARAAALSLVRTAEAMRG